MNRFTWEPEDLEIMHEDSIVIPTGPAELAERAKIADGPLPEASSNRGTVTNPGPGIRALSPTTSKKLDGILGRRTDEWSDAAREAAAEARRANASNNSPQEATRRAEYASGVAKKAKGEARAAAHGRASALHEIAAEKNPSGADHLAKAAAHAAQAERISNPGKRAPNAGMYAGANPTVSASTRRMEPTASGEVIHAGHGISDQSGRAVGGRATITSEPEGHRVLLEPTRNGEKFGAYGHDTTVHATLEGARAHANAGLDKQREHFLKKSAEVAGRGVSK